MNNIVYSDFIYRFVTQELKVEGETLKVALLNNEYLPDTSHAFYSDISNYEISGNGYVKGGKELEGLDIVKDTENGLVKIVADDTVWEATTITSRYAVVYIENSESLIACFDFETQKSSLNGNFTIEWSDDGLIQFGGIRSTFSMLVND